MPLAGEGSVMSEHNSSPENGAVGNKTDEAGTNNVEPGKSTEHATSATLRPAKQHR